MAQSKALEFLQKRALNIIFPGGEYATNLIIAIIKTLSHDNRKYHSVYSDGRSFLMGGGHGPPSDPLPMDSPLPITHYRALVAVRITESVHKIVVAGGL